MVAEGLVSDSSGGLKSRMQGLASCLAVFTRMRLTHKNQHLESADNAIKYLSLECARLLLGVEFMNAKPNDLTISVFCNITKSCLKQHDGDSTCCQWFKMLKTLAEDPWNSQQMFSIISGDELTDKCISEFIDGVEHPELILLRIEILLGNNCEDIAIRLIERFTQVKCCDVHLMSRLLMLLHNAEQFDEFHKQCTNISCCMACDILRHVHENERMYCQHTAVLLMSRTFLILDWTKNTDMTCTRVLLRYWLTLERHHLAENETEFLVSFDKVIALAHSSTQLIMFIDVTESLFGSMYLVPCVNVALRVLRSERHRLDCARLYLKDRIEIRNASRLLACVCNVLARCFNSHRQMKMTCLLSAACISPSNDRFVSVQDFFKSSSELVSLQPVAPSGVEWKTYMAVWDAVKYLQPPWFHLSVDWLELNRLLRSHFRKAGWRYDSLAMVFKNNHNKRGIGVVGILRSNRGEGALTPEKLKTANLEFNALRCETKKNRTKTLTAKRKDFGISKKKPAAVLVSSTVKADDNSHPNKKKANTLRKFKKSALTPCKISGKVSEKETVNLSEDIKQRKETVVQKQSDGNVIVNKRKLPSTFNDENRKIRRRKEDSNASLVAKKLCKTKKRLANCKMKLIKSPETESIFKEAESRGIRDLDCCDNLRVAASPCSSNDSQATILMDNSDSGLCNSVLSSSDNLTIDTMNCGEHRMAEGKDADTGNYGHLVDEKNYEVDSSKETIEKNVVEKEFDTVLENQNGLQNSDDWMFQDWSEFGKRAFALEAGESQHGNVDDYVGLECSQNGKGFQSSDLISCSEMCNEGEIPMDVANSNSTTDIDENILPCHRGKRKEDGNGQFADHEIALEKEDGKLDDCKESVNSTSVVGSAEVSNVENIQTLSGDYLKNLSSLQSSTDANGPSKQTFKCSHCSKIYSSLLSVRHHMINIHKVGFACPFCQKLIGSKWGRFLHMARMHRTECHELYRRKSTEGFKCGICFKSLPSLFGRRLHLARCHSVYNRDNDEEHLLNYSEVDIVKNKDVIHSEAETSTLKPDSRSKRGKGTLITGVNKCRRSTSKYKQDRIANQRGGNKLFKLESLRQRRVRRKASTVVGLKTSKKELRPYLCPELPLESPAMNGCELLVEENSAKVPDDNDTPVSVCGVVDSRSSEDEPFNEFNATEQPGNAPCDLNANLHETDTPVCDQTTFRNGYAVSSLYLKNCCVRLKRLCLSKIKLRECHVVMERLSLEQIADRDSNGVQSLHPDVSVNCDSPLEDCHSPLEQQDLQNDVTLDSLNSVEQQDVPVNSSPAQVPPHQLSETVTNKEVSDGQCTEPQNGHVPEVSSSRLLTVDVCSPSPSCKSNSDASLKKSSADVLPSKMLTVDVCSPSPSCKTSSDASLKKFSAIGACSAFPSKLSSSLSVPSPVACFSCPTAAGDSQSLSRSAGDTAGVSVVDILRSTGSVLFGTQDQMNGDDCLEKLYDSSSSTEVESELADTIDEMGKSPLLSHQLQDFQSALYVDNERRPGLLAFSDATEHVRTDCSKVPRRKLLVNRRRMFSSIEEGRDKKSKLYAFQSAERQRDQSSRFGKERSTKVRLFKGKACQVEVVPLGVLDSGVSNVSNVGNRASDSINKAKVPERKTVRKNLFESFEENIIKSGAKKSSDDCSQQPNGLSKHLLDNDGRSSGKPSEIIQRLKNQQRICKIQAMKAIAISLKDKFMLAAPTTSGSTKFRSSLPCMSPTKSRAGSGLVERIERVAVPVSFSRSGNSLPVVDLQQLSGAVECLAETDTSTALRGSTDSEDVCVISSDEEVQVIDLDDADSCRSSSDTEGSCTRQEHAWRTNDRFLATRQRALVDGRISRVRYCSLNNSAVRTSCDFYCCDLCPKSFTDNKLLMEHRRTVHRQASTGDKIHSDLQNEHTDKYYHRKSNESLSRSLTDRLHRPLETKSSVGRFSFYSSRSALRHFKPKLFGYRDGQPGFSAQKSLC